MLELPQGLWGLTETHLTDSGIKDVSRRLKFEARQMARNIRVCAGSPAPPRVQDSSCGSWTGVLQMADVPMKPVTVPWRGAEHSSGRVVVTCAHMGQVPILGATMYGAAKSPTFVDPVRITSGIAQTLTEEIVDGAHGMRFIMGDFNVDDFELPQTQYWKSQGWQEIQMFAAERWHQPRQPTCKRVTIRDFLWISPELVPHVQQVCTMQDQFPDHAALYAVFEHAAFSPPRIQQWPMPKRIPWEEVNVEAWQRHCDQTYSPHHWTENLQRDFAVWSQKVERSLDGYVQSADHKLPKGCGGRGQARKPRSSLMQLPQMKAARPGEALPASSLLARPVQLWYKQLRRLQSLRHGLRNGYHTPGAMSYQLLCWRSMLAAPGFEPNFQLWWPNRSVKLYGAPADIPDFCPDLQTIEILYDDYYSNYRSFEAWNLKKRCAYLQTKRETEHKDLFRALKDEPKQPLDYLLKTSEHTIIAVDSEHGTVKVNEPLALQSTTTTLQDLPAVVHSASAQTSPADSSWYSIESDVVPVPGQTLKQITALSTFDAIQQELINLWKPRWNHHETLPTDVWDRVLAFAWHYFPQLQLPYAPISHIDICEVLRAGKGLRTKGPDAWDKGDILALPSIFGEDMAGLFSTVERGIPWPSQIVQGHVNCLEKVHGASQVGQFRPVVLFSLWYRIYGSIRSRLLLSALEQYANFPAFGYLKGRSCAQVTFYVQTAIEHSLATGGTACGMLSDVEKCFNFLPRKPLLQMAKRLGIHSNILNAWSSFLHQMKRRFKIQGNLGEELSSTSGMPEGDSMSCVGMLVANFCFHYYMQFFKPNITAISFVDNLELFGRHPGELISGFIAMQTWAQLLQLQLDVKKTAFWSTDPQHRALFRSFQLHTIEDGLDLGASLQYAASHRNSALQSRMKSVMPFWTKLRQLSASTWHKQLAVKMALLPKALHASSHTVIGKHWIRKLRSGVMRGLRFNNAGANPVARLVLLGPVDIDPGFYDLWTSFKLFVLQLQRCEQIRHWWSDFVNASMRRTYGPFAKISIFLADFGWHIDGDCILTIVPDFKLCLLEVDFPTLRMILEYHWRQLACIELQHRWDFADLQNYDYAATMHSHHLADRGDSHLLACIMDGTFFLETQKAKFDSQKDGLCHHCLQTADSLEHRVFDCPHYQSIREVHGDCLRDWHSLPRACTHHGLIGENPWQTPFWKALSHIPWHYSTWHSVPHDSSTQHIFVDGSCRDPSSPVSSLAGWAAINANTGLPIGASLIPTIRHTINRGELWAICMTLVWGTLHMCDLHIYTDSQYVLQGCVYLEKHGALPDDWDNLDFWRHYMRCRANFLGTLAFTKVRAHIFPGSATTEHEHWLAQWNQQADITAKAATQCSEHSSIHHLWTRLREQHESHCMLAKRFQVFLLAMAHRSLQRQALEDADEEFEFCARDPSSTLINDQMLQDFFAP